MCVVVQSHAFEVGLVDSVDPGELETADPEAAADDTAPETPRLLCSDGNDPRCSPLNAQDTPASPDMPARIDALPSAAPNVPPPFLVSVGAFGETTLLGPNAGPVSELLRPPRA